MVEERIFLFRIIIFFFFFQAEVKEEIAEAVLMKDVACEALEISGPYMEPYDQWITIGTNDRNRFVELQQDDEHIEIPQVIVTEYNEPTRVLDHTSGILEEDLIVPTMEDEQQDIPSPDEDMLHDDNEFILSVMRDYDNKTSDKHNDSVIFKPGSQASSSSSTCVLEKYLNETMTFESPRSSDAPLSTIPSDRSERIALPSTNTISTQTEAYTFRRDSDLSSGVTSLSSGTHGITPLSRRSLENVTVDHTFVENLFKKTEHLETRKLPDLPYSAISSKPPSFKGSLYHLDQQNTSEACTKKAKDNTIEACRYCKPIGKCVTQSHEYNEPITSNVVNSCDCPEPIESCHDDGTENLCNFQREVVHGSCDHTHASFNEQICELLNYGNKILDDSSSTVGENPHIVSSNQESSYVTGCREQKHDDILNNLILKSEQIKQSVVEMFQSYEDNTMSSTTFVQPNCIRIQHQHQQQQHQHRQQQRQQQQQQQQQQQHENYTRQVAVHQEDRDSFCFHGNEQNKYNHFELSPKSQKETSTVQSNKGYSSPCGTNNFIPLLSPAQLKPPLITSQYKHRDENYLVCCASMASSTESDNELCTNQDHMKLPIIPTEIKKNSVTDFGGTLRLPCPIEVRNDEREFIRKSLNSQEELFLMNNIELRKPPIPSIRRRHSFNVDSKVGRKCNPVTLRRRNSYTEGISSVIADGSTIRTSTPMLQREIRFLRKQCSQLTQKLVVG